ncbi:hypothetical protein DERP_000920 [Dermatophagoides pteronyssinus]|uniref:Uncharacterized protein n=1 Tax=Dermatophagoides pteronyssinus TaxID=6956 RepID=A0ABQ8JD20_DERPT|nr:hypothetical protein DERP_000920 [Dermatophagoides pteronyssinus]
MAEIKNNVMEHLVRLLNHKSRIFKDFSIGMQKQLEFINMIKDCQHTIHQLRKHSKDYSQMMFEIRSIGLNCNNNQNQNCLQMLPLCDPILVNDPLDLIKMDEILKQDSIAVCHWKCMRRRSKLLLYGINFYINNLMRELTINDSKTLCNYLGYDICLIDRYEMKLSTILTNKNTDNNNIIIPIMDGHHNILNIDHSTTTTTMKQKPNYFNDDHDEKQTQADMIKNDSIKLEPIDTPPMINIPRYKIHHHHQQNQAIHQFQKKIITSFHYN